MNTTHILQRLLFLILLQVPVPALAQDSVTVLVDLSGGAYGALGSHILGRRVGAPRDTLAAVTVRRGQRLVYHFAARGGWDPPLVELMGHGPAPADSTLIPQEPLILIVAARRIPKLIPETQRLYALQVQALRSSAPVPIYQDILCESVKLFTILPQDSAVLVSEWASVLAEAAVADTHAPARLDSLLGGKAYDLKCDPKQ